MLCTAQTADNYDGDVLNAYFGHQLEMIPVTPGFTPPVASRALGYTGLCAYESVVHGIPTMNSFEGIIPQLAGLPQPDTDETYHWGVVANHAMYVLTAGLYNNASTENLNVLSDLRDSFDAEYAAGTLAEVMTASATYGESIGSAMLAYANLDGAENCQLTNFPAEYIPPTGPGLWAPLSGQMALQPYWGDKRCFVVEYADLSMIAPEPPSYSDEVGSDLYQEALAVYDAVNNLTPEQAIIAEYWADGGGTVTPPGHSVSMLRNILIHEEEDLAFAAMAYARLGMAVSDAFVLCWKTKYHYNLLRPVHYINDVIDADWTTYISTPPFPEYTSGHSTQSGAFGSVMTAIYGNNYAFIDSTHGELYGGPRSFNNFVECAEETAISRLYGGIHFPVGNNEGSALGDMVGDMVNMLFEMAVSTDDVVGVAPQVQAYPNPTQGNIIVGGSNGSVVVEVFDLSGRKLETSYSRQLDLTSYPRGIYLLQVSGMDGVLLGTERIILE
jgi:hypothetical protein